MKNARNEANRYETQADERQEDRTHVPDSESEKRTQLQVRSDVAAKP
jgi:hypothetical protein